TVTKIVRCVHVENSPTSRITEKRRFILEYSGKHEVQVTGKTALAQISNPNRQQITNKNSNSVFNTARRITARTADNTSKRDFKSVRTPKLIAVEQYTFKVRRKFNTFQDDSTLLCDPSAVLFIVSPTGRDVTWNHLHKSGSRQLIEISRKF
ncbi:hypothetical protein AVEN_121943-1, partial [Araneus ventricosus]